MDNFELMTIVGPESLEILQDEVDRKKEYWGAAPFRTNFEGSPHREAKDILIRGPRFDTLDMQELYNRIPCEFYNTSEGFPRVREAALVLLNILQGTALGRVILTRIPPSGQIYSHSDEGEAADWYDRFHLVISSAEKGNYFYSGDEQVEMKAGEIWWVNNHIPHSVKNKSEEDRIHMILDIQRT
jgi:hypothetical protein